MRQERDAGRTRLLGVSNVSLGHLEQMAEGSRRASCICAEPLLRSPRMGSRSAPVLPRSERIIYQGFSLLTANVEVLRHPLVAVAVRHGFRCHSGPDCVRVCAGRRHVAADRDHRMRTT